MDGLIIGSGADQTTLSRSREPDDSGGARGRLGVVGLLLTLLLLTACGRAGGILPGIAPADREYLTALSQNSRDLSRAIGVLSTQARRFGTDPNVAADPQWQAEMAGALGTIRDRAAEAETLKPPPSLTDLHGKYLAGTRRYDEMAGAFSEALVSGSPADMQRATRLMDEGNAALKDALDVIKQLQ